MIGQYWTIEKRAEINQKKIKKIKRRSSIGRIKKTKSEASQRNLKGRDVISPSPNRCRRTVALPTRNKTAQIPLFAMQAFRVRI